MLKPLLLSCAIAAALTSPLTYAAPAKNVIFFLGDGMEPPTYPTQTGSKSNAKLQ